MEYIVRMSVLVFVRRLYTPHISPYSNHAFLGLMVFCTALFVSGFVSGFTQCDPPAANWNIRVLVTARNKCPNRFQVGVTLTVLGVVCNLVLLGLAIHKIWHLRVLGRARAGIILLLSLGALACVFAVWRLFLISFALETTDVTCEYLASHVSSLLS
jgi:hypothetical protein